MKDRHPVLKVSGALHVNRIKGELKRIDSNSFRFPKALLTIRIKDNFFSAELKNKGSATIDDITFSSDKPEGWTIEFTPEEVSSLAAGKTKTIDINIKPDAKAIAGDYSVSFKATSEEATAQNLEIRVTVETPTIWGWTGVGIIVVVIAGLAFVIMRFSRR